MASELIAYCGLYCGACSFRLAAEENDRDHLRAMPVAYDHLKEEPLERCLGCRLEAQCGPCTIRDCARNRELDYCSQCRQYPCEKLTAFAHDGKPHHGEVLSNLTLLQQVGETSWLEQMNKKWTCRCGVRKSWYYSRCHCGQQNG